MLDRICCSSQNRVFTGSCDQRELSFAECIENATNKNADQQLNGDWLVGPAHRLGFRVTSGGGRNDNSYKDAVNSSTTAEFRTVTVDKTDKNTITRVVRCIPENARCRLMKLPKRQPATGPSQRDQCPAAGADSESKDISL